MILRRFMWVIYKGKVGILTAFDNVQAVVDFVDPEGYTEFAGVKVPVMEIRQASFNQIPAPRKPDIKIAQQLGYL